MKNIVWAAPAASVLVLSSCASAHLTSEPAAGIYELTVRGDVDRCSPARETGAVGPVGVASLPGVLSLSVPDPTRTSMAHVSLSGEAGFHDSTTMALSECTGASLERAYTVLSADGEAISIAYRESWSGMAGCSAAMRARMPAAPAADCVADLILDYRLTEACGPSCQVAIVGDAPACLCD